MQACRFDLKATNHLGGPRGLTCPSNVHMYYSMLQRRATGFIWRHFFSVRQTLYFQSLKEIRNKFKPKFPLSEPGILLFANDDVGCWGNSSYGWSWSLFSCLLGSSCQWSIWTEHSEWRLISWNFILFLGLIPLLLVVVVRRRRRKKGDVDISWG